MLNQLQPWAQVAPLFTPVVALAAVLVAWRQLRLNRASQRETTAKATFREYLKLTVQYPDFAEGRCPANGEDKERYKWFVGYFIWAAEEVLDYAPKDRVWHANLQMLANLHGPYFRSADFTEEEYKSYTPRAQALINKAKARSEKV